MTASMQATMPRGFGEPFTIEARPLPRPMPLPDAGRAMVHVVARDRGRPSTSYPDAGGAGEPWDLSCSPSSGRPPSRSRY